MKKLELQVTPEQVLALIRQFSKEEQKQLLTQLKKNLDKPDAKSKPALDMKEDIDFYMGINSLPPMESLEEIREKYALKKEYLEPLKELFQDAPSAEELIEMLKQGHGLSPGYARIASLSPGIEHVFDAGSKV